MEICTYCRRPILTAQLVWGQRLVSRATRSEPAEYSDDPFHRTCYELQIEAEQRGEDDHERHWARALANGADDYS